MRGILEVNETGEMGPWDLNEGYSKETQLLQDEVTKSFEDNYVEESRQVVPFGRKKVVINLK